MTSFALSILTQIEFNFMAGWPMKKRPLHCKIPTSRDIDVLLMLQKYKCYYCGEEINHAASNDQMRASIDHVVPLMAGGKNELANKVASCQKCNTAKGCLPVDKFTRIARPAIALQNKKVFPEREPPYSRVFLILFVRRFSVAASWVVVGI